MQLNYLINLIDSHPRRYRVIEGTLQGRQTVATLFWAQQYGIQGWFGYRRNLSRDAYDQQLAQWAQAGLLAIDQQAKTVRLTARGQRERNLYRHGHYQPRCGHLSWIVNTTRFANRFLLGIQTVSELAHQNNRYVPLDVPPAEMAAVKQWFYRYRPALVSGVAAECFQLGHLLEQTDPRWPQLLAASLVGYQTSGLYDQQLRQLLKLSADSLALLKHDVWLTVAATMLKKPDWLLSRLTKPLLRQLPLSRSAGKTLACYRSGIPLDEISRRRRIKITTVREHLLAAAIQLPGSVDARQLIGPKRWAEFADLFRGPVASWHWTPQNGSDPAESFFAFRLYQIVRSQQDG